MSESWLAVVGCAGYAVSDAGRVYSFRQSGRYLRPVATGYPRVNLGGRTRLIHQLVLEAFVGPRPEGLVTRHLNGNPRDNRLANLRWGTHQENSADAMLHGTMRGRGRTFPEGSEARAFIQRSHAAGHTVGSLARAFGVSKYVIRQCVVARVAGGG